MARGAVSGFVVFVVMSDREKLPGCVVLCAPILGNTISGLAGLDKSGGNIGGWLSFSIFDPDPLPRVPDGTSGNNGFKFTFCWSYVANAGSESGP